MKKGHGQKKHNGGRRYANIDYRDGYRYRTERQGGGNRRSGGRGPLIFAACLIVVVAGIIAMQSMGVFDITLASPNIGVTPSPQVSAISDAPASSAAGNTPAPEPTGEPTAKPTPTPAPSPTGPPIPADAPAYAYKYPDLWVEKGDFKEHEEGDKVVYLTFDDGPCKSTKRLLDVLDELDVKATFFVSAQFGDREKIIEHLKMTFDKGHEVAVHTYNHNYKEIYSSVDDFLDDYKKMDDIILEATGKRSRVYRFPGGSNNGYAGNIREELLKEMDRRGFIHHDWNASNGDSDGYDYYGQINKVITEVSYNEKNVVLMHNTPDKDMVIDSLPEIVRSLKEKGYRFDVIDETVRPFQFEKVCVE